MPTTSAPGRDVFYSRFNRVMAVLVWAIMALIAVSLFFAPPGPHLFYLVPLAFLALAAWEALWSPTVEVDDHGITLTNVFRTVRIPWPALVHIDTKYALTLFTPKHRYSAWAATAPGRGAALRAQKQDTPPGRSGVPLVNGTARPGDLLSSESGQAAHLVRSRWSRLRDEDRIEAGVAESTPVEVIWHRSVSTGLAVLAVASLVAILLA
jgi:hypothetical protein